MLGASIRGLSALTPKGHDVPYPAFPISLRRFRPVVFGLIALSLCGCMAAKKTADIDDAAAPDTQADAAQPLQAKGGTPASAKYVDPLVATSAHQSPHSSAPGAPATQAAMPATGAYPPAPAQASGSIAGLSTQPTGVRAGSSSIFSVAPSPAMGGSQGQGQGPSGTGISATTGSMFTPRQPLPQSACPTDAAGVPLNC